MNNFFRFNLTLNIVKGHRFDLCLVLYASQRNKVNMFEIFRDILDIQQIS